MSHDKYVLYDQTYGNVGLFDGGGQHGWKVFTAGLMTVYSHSAHLTSTACEIKRNRLSCESDWLFCTSCMLIFPPLPFISYSKVWLKQLTEGRIKHCHFCSYEWVTESYRKCGQSFLKTNASFCVDCTVLVLAVIAGDPEWEKEIKREKRGITVGMLVCMSKTSESHWPDELFFWQKMDFSGISGCKPRD